MHVTGFRKTILGDKDKNDRRDGKTESEQHTSGTILPTVNAKQVSPDAKDRKEHCVKTTKPMTCKQVSYTATYYTSTLNRDTR